MTTEIRTTFTKNMSIILQQIKRCTAERLLFRFIVIITILIFGVLYSNQWNNQKTRIYQLLQRHIWGRSMVAEDIEKYHHKLLIWVAAYDPSANRDQYILQDLAMAKDICESSTPNSFVRLFIATCSHAWNTTHTLREFKTRNRYNIAPITNTSLSNDFIIIEHFKWSCVEFIIGYYKTNLNLALPFQHRKYFQQHINEFDWFWYTEDDLSYDSRTYWKLVKDTSFALNKLSSTQTYDLLTLYAHKAKKPKLSTSGRYYFLPTLLRYEKPVKSENSSAMQPIGNLDLWRLTDLGLTWQPVFEALIFYNEQWWLQPTNSHSAYYLLPREHLHVIVNDSKWLIGSNMHHREWVSSFWLLDYGYIRVASLTNFDQYFVHHASNRYYDHPINPPKASTIIRALGFEYKNGHFLPATSLIDADLLKYTVNHTSDIASCFPLFLSPVPNRPHEAIPTCTRLLNKTKTN